MHTALLPRISKRVRNWAHHPILAPRLLLALGLLLAIGLGQRQSEVNTRIAKARFDAVARRTVEQVRERMQIYEYGLRGARGAVVSAGYRQLDRQLFLRYTATRDTEAEFPGARGIGVIWRVPAEEADRFESAMQRRDSRAFHIRQLTPHAGERYVITFIEPENKNAQAVGLDVASEKNRRTAAEAAMRTGKATLTGPITLVQAKETPIGSFLLLLPIYDTSQPLTTPQEREAAAVGWSYAPLVTREVLSDFDLAQSVSLALSDVEDGQTFYSSNGHEQARSSHLDLALQFPVYGRTWHAELRATPAFVRELNLFDPRLLVLIFGGLAGLLAVLLRLFLQSAVRERELRAEQERRAAMVTGSSDAIIGQGLDGVITDWNLGAERLFGYSASQAVGRLASELILPAEHAAEDAMIRERIAHGEVIPAFDTTRMRADGTLVDVSVAASPLIGGDGRRVGTSNTIRDIAEAKRAEHNVLALNMHLEQQVTERTTLLETARRDLQKILDAVPSVIGYCDKTLRHRFANHAYHAWFGVDPERLPGSPVSSLLGEDFERDLPRMQAALRGDPQSFEVAFQRGGVERNAVTEYLPDILDGEVQGFYVIMFDITQQTLDKRRLSAALRENEALLGTLHLHALVSVTDRSGRILDANDNFCQISGYDRLELLNQNHRIINSGLHEASFWRDMWRTIASGQPWRGEICNRKKDGSTYWVDSMIAPFTDENGQVEKYISIRTDITAAKLAERKLRSSQDFLDRASRVAGVGAWQLDLATQQLAWSAQMYSIYGLPQADKPSLVEAWDFFPEPGRSALRAVVDQAMQGSAGWDLELPFVTAQGVQRWVRSVGEVETSTAGPVRLVGTMQDITERKRVAVELVAASSLLRSVLESASEVSIIATDPNLNIKVFNRGAEKLLGYSSTEVVDIATPVLIHDLYEIRERAKELTQQTGQVVEGGDVFTHPLVLRQPREWTYVRKDGSRVRVSLVVTAMYSSDQTINGYLGVAHDVTLQKETELSLREARHRAEQASQAKSQFLANMSHEIRTPMNAVLGLSYLMGQTALDSEQSALLSKLHMAGKSLLALLNDILDLSKIEAGELSIERASFNLPRLLRDIHEVARVQADTKHISFRMHVATDVPELVEGDATRLSQVVTNLLSNAVKFTDQGGVELRVACLASTETTATLEFRVIDTGIGIVPEVRSRVFAPFAQADASTTRRFGGTGLGLSIVKRLTELMGGKVELVSQPDVGSEFTVTLQLNRCATALGRRASIHPAVRSGRLSGIRILVVDDSDINRDVAKGILELDGAWVVLAHDGKQAVDRLRDTPDAFDIVLMDVQMPVLDGHQATRRIRNELLLKTLPIIALTADARASERERATAAGMNDFISKPFDPPALVRTVARLVAQRQSRSPSSRGLSENTNAIASVWPEVKGIDTEQARSLLLNDAGLFRKVLGLTLNAFQDIGSEPLSTPDELAHGAARFHKLKGASGQFAATAIHAAAEQAEDACLTGNGELARHLCQQLAELLRQLRSNVAALLATESPESTQSAPGSTTPPLPVQSVTELAQLLRQQDFSALERFNGLTLELKHFLGPELFARVNRHVQALQFNDAARLLDPTG